MALAFLILRRYKLSKSRSCCARKQQRATGIISTMLLDASFSELKSPEGPPQNARPNQQPIKRSYWLKRIRRSCHLDGQIWRLATQGALKKRAGAQPEAHDAQHALLDLLMRPDWQPSSNIQHFSGRKSAEGVSRLDCASSARK